MVTRKYTKEQIVTVENVASSGLKVERVTYLALEIFKLIEARA